MKLGSMNVDTPRRRRLRRERDERRARLAEFLKTYKGKITAKELAPKFLVSVSAMQSDLKELRERRAHEEHF